MKPQLFAFTSAFARRCFKSLTLLDSGNATTNQAKSLGESFGSHHQNRVKKIDEKKSNEKKNIDFLSLVV